MKIILFDFETNGIDSESSVLEAAFIKIDLDQNGEIIKKDILHRYYLPNIGEAFDLSAYKTHGLSIKKIKEKRNCCSYSESFKDDQMSNDYLSFFKDVELLVAHNIDFDSQFLKYSDEFEWFCTMKDMKNVIKALNVNGKIKNPSLQEFCEYYNLKFDTTKAHGALYDTEMLTKGFISAFKNQDIFIFKKEKIENEKSIIRNKFNFRQTTVKEILFEIEDNWFVLSDKSLYSNSSFLRVYDKKTGNLFMAFPEYKLKDVLNNNEKILEIKSKLLDIIHNTNYKNKQNEFTSKYGFSSQVNLFEI